MVLSCPREEIMRTSPVITASIPTFLCALAALLVVTVTSPETALAQDAAQLKEARGNFQRATELEHAKDWGGALRLFRDVGSVKMTAQVRYHIATCEENLGQLVAALGGYELALSQAEDMHPDFIAEVQGAIDKLNARIPKVRIVRGEGSEAASIQLDGVALGESSLGLDTAMNPGPHTVTATAPGFGDFSETITLSEGSTETLTVVLVPLVEEAKVPVVQAPATQEEQKGYGVLPYAIGGAGLGVAALGGLFLGISQGKVGKAKDLCGGGKDCRDASPADQAEAQKLVSGAKTLEAVGWVTVVIGVAGVATGTVLYFLDKQETTDGTDIARLKFVPVAPASDAGFSFIGAF
jgi:hypothetical protein